MMTLVPALALTALAVAPAGAAPTRRAGKSGSAAQPARTPRPAVAFSHDGKLLAVGGYREVSLIRTADGQVERRLSGPAGAVTSVQFAPGGGRLAAGGGVPGRSGEIRVWDLSGGEPKLLTGAHTDVVYSIAWSPDGKTIAAGSYDRLVTLWDVETGAHRVLKDHTDSVYAVAFSPDGRRLASASADRTVKVWDAASGRRLFTLSDATAELYTVAFHPSGTQVAAAGVDRMLRKWNVTGSSGTLARSAFAHDGPIVRLVYTPDGEGVYTASEDGSIKLWGSVSLEERKVFERQPDWPLGLALSPDEKLLAVTRYDGSAALYDAATGQRRLGLGLDRTVRETRKRGRTP